tara:strand:+ start:37 stop:1212 length:1176 start_codon:yes stop_codon:yes gene_type:complete
MSDSGVKIEIRDMSNMLADRIDAVVRHLSLDAVPSYVSQNCLYPLNPTRADTNPGSFYIYLAGEKRGSWYDRATGDHGDALDLVAYVDFNRDLKKAYKWGLTWLGLSDVSAPEVHQRANDARLARARREKEAEAKAKKTRKAAQALWLGPRDEPNKRAVEGGLCDLYLKGRSIDMLGRCGELPGCVRETMKCKVPLGWLGPHGRSHVPALLLAVHNAQGFLACHRVYLDVTFDGDRPVAARKAMLEPVDLAQFNGKMPKNRSKFVYGDFWGGSIRIYRGPTGKRIGDLVSDDPTAITEGFENGCGLAVSLADTDDQYRIVASLSLSNMGNVELPDVIRTLTLVGENDGSEEARKAFERACQAHAQAGRDVFRVWPPAGVNDVNDMLTAGAQ